MLGRFNTPAAAPCPATSILGSWCGSWCEPTGTLRILAVVRAIRN